MKIATTTEDFGKYCKTDEERIRELHRAGFRYIDLSMNFTPDSPYMQSGWETEVKKIKELAAELNMSFVQAHSVMGNCFSENESHIEHLVAATVRSIEICNILGIKNTVVHNGSKRGVGKEECFEKNKRFYQKLFPAMEKYDVNVLTENKPSSKIADLYRTSSGADIKELVEYVDHPLFHACWDVGHANCNGSQYDDILALGKDMYAIHYHDNRGCDDEHLLPYFGILNHDEIIAALSDVGFGGYFTLEATSSLIPSSYVYGDRRVFEKSKLLSEPQLFMRRHLESLLYDTAKHILSSYGVFEE